MMNNLLPVPVNASYDKPLIVIQRLAHINASKNKYQLIQVLRIIAALMVIILHATLYAKERLQSGLPLYAQGFNGVPLFFAISGFVMIISSEKLMNTRNGWKTFAIKRIVRIVPVYWLLITFKIIILLCATTVVYHARLDIVYIIKSYLFIPALSLEGKLFPFYGVGWTLNFEMFFYFLFTIALAFRINPILFLSLVFIPLSILSTYNIAAWPAVSFYTNNIVLYFLYGMVGAKLILMNIKLPQKISVPTILAGLLYLFVPHDGFFADNMIINSIAVFLIVYGCASVEKTWSTKVPSWMIYLGAASYSIYLTHPSFAPIAPTILKMLHLKMPVLSVILSGFIAVAIGSLFYKICEKPITDIISKYLKGRPGKAGVNTALISQIPIQEI